MNAKAIGEGVANSVQLIDNTYSEAMRVRHELASEIASAIRLERLFAISIALDLPVGDVRVIEIAERLDR